MCETKLLSRRILLIYFRMPEASRKSFYVYLELLFLTFADKINARKWVRNIVFFFSKIFTSSSGQTYCFPTWIRYEYGILEVCNVACVQGCPVFMPSCLNVNTSHWAIYSGRLTESFGICTSSRASCSGRFGYVVALRPMYLVFVVSSEQILRHCNRQVIDVPACFYNLSLSHSTM